MTPERKKGVKFARRLRREQTDAETLLWSQLRGRREDGYKFRRQHPVGSYVLDFACPSHKLAIEVDGHTHSTDSEITKDQSRTHFLESKGWTVIRFWNDDIFNDLQNVENFILHKLHTQTTA